MLPDAAEGESAVTVCGIGETGSHGSLRTGEKRIAREISLVAPGSLFGIPVVKVALRVEAYWAGKVSSMCQAARQPGWAERTRRDKKQETRAHRTRRSQSQC